MMWVSRKLSTNAAFPSAGYAPPPPASSTERPRQTGTTTSTFPILPPPSPTPPSAPPPSAPPPSHPPPPPPSRHSHNRRSRRRSRRAKSLRARRRNVGASSMDEDQRRGTTTTTGRRDGGIEKGLDGQKGSDEAAYTTQGLPPPWWRMENRKKGYNRYAALSSTEEDADFESQEYGNAGYGVCIGGGGGLLVLQGRLENKKCDKSHEEGLRRINLLEQDSGIDIDHDAPNTTGNRQQQQEHLAGADGWKEGCRVNMAPPRLDDFTFSFPSPLTETTTTLAPTGMATRKTKTAADAEAASLPDMPTLSANNRYFDGNKAVVLSPPPSGGAPSSLVTSLLDLFRGNDGEGKELAEQILFSSLAGNDEEEAIRYFLNKASLYQASRPVPQALALPISSKPVPPASSKLTTMQGWIPVCLPASSIDNTPPDMMMKKNSKEEEKESGCYGLSSARENDAWALTTLMRGGWPDQGLCSMMWKNGDDDNDRSSNPALIGGSERRRSGMIKMSLVFSLLGGVGGDRGNGDDEDAKPKRAVAKEEEEAGWLEYIVIPPRFDFGQGQGAARNGNGKVGVTVVAGVAGDGDEEEEEEDKGLLGGLFEEIEIIGNEREGDELESESEIGGVWGWDVINRVEAYL